MLLRWETPEHTEGYEGFYHLISIEGTVEETVLTYIIRDHDRDRFERRKKELEHLTRKINNEFPGCASIEIKDQYYNMREKIEPVMHIIDVAIIFAGGLNFHGRYEFVPIPSMEKASQVIVEIARLVAEEA